MTSELRPAVEVWWSEPSPPNDESSYDHCIASFKFGTLKAEWKSWKDHPGYTVFFEGCNNFIGTYNTLADAKKAGETWVSTALGEGRMIDKLRPAKEVWWEATDQAMGSACGIVDCEECSTAAAVIEADREAVRAPLLAEIERLTIQLEVESQPSPYCPICGSCGEDGCCGPQRCLYPTTEQAAENERLRAALENVLAHRYGNWCDIARAALGDSHDQ